MGALLGLLGIYGEHPKTGERLIFLLNYSDTAQLITLHREATDLLSGTHLHGSVTLGPYDVWVLAEGGLRNGGQR